MWKFLSPKKANKTTVVARSKAAHRQVHSRLTGWPCWDNTPSAKAVAGSGGFLRAAEGAGLSYCWSRAVLGASIRLDAKANGHAEPMLWPRVCEERRVPTASSGEPVPSEPGFSEALRRT